MTATDSDPTAPYAAFGEVRAEPLSKIQKLAGAHLARNWSRIPHVFHQDEADVSAIEAQRQSLAVDERPSLLAFVAEAVGRGLKTFPRFNSSLDEGGGMLVLKDYINLGFAIDTPRGLMVGVIADCDVKSPLEISRGVAELAAKARGKGLSMTDMAGGCLTISSLGGAGGTGFTPIINAPEVAILGLSRLIERPFRGEGDAVFWRPVLPISLSYDHRVVNGADAAAFMSFLRAELANPEGLSWA